MRQSRKKPIQPSRIGRPVPAWLQSGQGRWLLIPIFVLVIGLSAFLVRGSDGKGAGDDAGGLVPLSPALMIWAVVFFLAVAAIIALVGLMLAGVDNEAAPLAKRLSSGDGDQRLLERWLRRARWARNVGGAAGIIAWIFGTGTKGDLLLLGVGGIAIGAMLAEAHRSTPRGRTRTASLESRSLGDFLERRDLQRMSVVGVGAVILAVGDLATGAEWMIAPWAAAAVAVLGIALAVQYRIATRPRPALPEELRTADDLARRLAVGPGMAQPATYFALALVAHPLLPSLLGVAIWLVALALWWSNRRLGIERLIERGQLPAPGETAVAP